MKLDTFKSDAVLVLTATIWGLAFIAQRVGMEYVGPFTYNGIRFSLGAVSLLPLVYFTQQKEKSISHKQVSNQGLVKYGTLSGIVLFAGASLQQVGLLYTTAGKAGFITGLYIIFVPIFAFLFRQGKTSTGTWTGAILACIGLYFLSITKDLSMNRGDFLVLLCGIFFALHIIIIGRITKRFNTSFLALFQFSVCALLSLIVALVFESFILKDILNAALPLLYGGIFSVGIAYSLQIYGQKNSPASHAAIIMSLESVVAAIGGWFLLNEILTIRDMTGCALMLAGMLISQLFTLHSSSH